MSEQHFQRETMLIKGLHAQDIHGEVVNPIHLSTTFVRNLDGSYPEGRVYSRPSAVAYDEPETLLEHLEGGKEAALFASGMAAATTVLQSLKPGSRVVFPKLMYWALRKWLLHFGATWNVEVMFYDNADLADLESKLIPRAELLWIETPANPTMEITDIAAAAALGHRYGARVVVDSTVATPVQTRPLELGADLVLHSASKYLNGHSDVIAGALVTSERDAYWAQIKNLRALSGNILGPFEAWLLARGMKTLFVRVQAASASALWLAQQLAKQPQLEVLYAGLPTHPQHAIAQRQMHGGFGGLLAILHQGGERSAISTTNRVQLFKRATSLGAVESLIEHRASVEGMGTFCPNNLIRLSIGLEAKEDLLADLLQGINEEGSHA